MTTSCLLWGSMQADTQAPDLALEQAVGKQQSLVHLAQPWAVGRRADRTPKYQGFPQAAMDQSWDRGSLTMLDWGNWDLANKPSLEFKLWSITSGAHDVYLRAWARAAAEWAHPFMLRFDPEFNGAWLPWGAQPETFVAAWRYVHDLFVAEGATNVTWLWCPNQLAPAGSGLPTAADQLASYYPGDSYVDWTGFDAYNWASGKGEPWLGFADMVGGVDGWLGDTYGTLTSLAPDKPMALAEFGCWRGPTQKAGWITDALWAIPAHFPAIRAISYFNWDPDGATWSLVDSALDAFKAGISSPVWLAAGDWIPADGQAFGAPGVEIEVRPSGERERLNAEISRLTVREQAYNEVIEGLTRTMTDMQEQLSTATTEAVTARGQFLSVQRNLQALLQAAQGTS